MSLLSVAPYSLTGMLTIPKLMEPLQIALAIPPPREVGSSAGLFHTAGMIIHRFINITC